MILPLVTLWIIVLCAISPGAAAQLTDATPAETVAAGIFAAANTALRAGQTTAAIDGYARLLADGHDTAALWFNLGQAWRFSGRGEKATQCLRRAWQRAPWDREINRELSIHLATLGDRKPSFPLPLRGAAGLRRPGVWLALSLVHALLWLSSALCLGRTAGARLAVMGVILTALCAGATVMVALQIRQPEAVLNASQPIRVIPASTGRSNFSLENGWLVRIRGRHAGWLRVEDGYGRIGWLPADQVETL